MHYSNKRIGGPVNCPRCGKPNPSGFHDVEQCRWCGKYGMDSNPIIFSRGFQTGRKAVLNSKNSSGCACVFDENDNLIEVCLAHKEWYEKQRRSNNK